MAVLVSGVNSFVARSAALWFVSQRGFLLLVMYLVEEKGWATVSRRCMAPRPSRARLAKVAFSFYVVRFKFAVGCELSYKAPPLRKAPLLCNGLKPRIVARLT